MQSHIIGFIYEHENYSISQKDLEKEYSRRRSTITGILKLMEKNEYITRQYSKKDARVKIVTLTDKAIELHQQIVSRMETFNASLEKGLTPEEVDTFYYIMDKVKSNLE
jgi:DNA-binding MarR family transcriptional regulator